ncbi:MAG: CvpA family protein [Candidatus Omnitrophota bacterium]|jgi:uncharacterized membrane protein required for colicin V production
MLSGIINKLNWVDLVFVILIIRMGYVAVRNGFLVEIFKISGTILAIYLGCHYYASLAAFFHSRLGREGSPVAVPEALSFIVLCVLGYVIFILPRRLLMRFLKIEVVPLLNMWGGFILGICRGVLFSGLLFLAFSISMRDYLHLSVAQSFSGPRLVNVVAGTYSGIWNTVMSKFMHGEKYNAVLESVRSGLINK